jgi:hypothetical protein
MTNLADSNQNPFTTALDDRIVISDVDNFAEDLTADFDRLNKRKLLSPEIGLSASPCEIRFNTYQLE